MSKYLFLQDYSEAPGEETDAGKVVFLTDIFSDDFKYRIRDVVDRKDIPEELLDVLEEKQLVEPYTFKSSQKGIFFRKGAVVAEKLLGVDLAEKLTLSGVIAEVGRSEDDDDFAMKETKPLKATKKKAAKKKAASKK